MTSPRPTLRVAARVCALPALVALTGTHPEGAQTPARLREAFGSD